MASVAWDPNASSHGIKLQRDAADLVLAQRHAYFFARDMTDHLKRMHAVSKKFSSSFFKD